MITKTQIKKIHILKNILGFDDAFYRNILSVNFSINSCKKLSFKEAAELITVFEEEATAQGFWVKPNQRFEDLSGRTTMATPAQLRKIEVMWSNFLKLSNGKEISGKKTKQSLRKLLQRLYQVSDLRFLQRVKVSKVLKTIETMINQQLKAS